MRNQVVVLHKQIRLTEQVIVFKQVTESFGTTSDYLWHGYSVMTTVRVYRDSAHSDFLIINCREPLRYTETSQKLNRSPHTEKKQFQTNAQRAIMSQLAQHGLEGFPVFRSAELHSLLLQVFSAGC